jgi:two-component system, NarL family, response regulator LiaR
VRRRAIASDSTVTVESPPPTDRVARVLLADDDPLVRGALRDALGREPGISVEAEATDGREAVEMALHLHPDIVLMDVDLPGVDGVTATLRISRAAPDIRIVVFSPVDDDELGMLGLRAGASGFLMKDIPIEALGRALRGVSRGEAAVSRALTLRLIEQLREAPEGRLGWRPVQSNLTTREWQVLDLLCTGATTDGIARELVLSPETIRTHVKHILAKLGARSRAEAVLLAARMRSDDPSSGHSIDELTLRRLANRLRSRRP